jgi:hypothetical protein
MINSHFVIGNMEIEDYDCQFCGKQATQFVFAAFCCSDPECVEKARVERGGPGGHMKRKAQGLPIIFDEEKQ